MQVMIRGRLSVVLLALAVAACAVGRSEAGTCSGTIPGATCDNEAGPQLKALCQQAGGGYLCTNDRFTCTGFPCEDDAKAVCTQAGLDYSGCDDGCFPADAQVELESGVMKRMGDLRVGDRVRVSATEFSDVLVFSHQLERVNVEFVVISTADGASIRLTPNHYLYVNGTLTAARRVAVGDMLRRIRHGAGSGMVGALESGDIAVTSVSMAWGEGLFNPHTIDGDIVVDGILTSTYTTTVAPGLAHALLWPLRLLYSLGLAEGGSYAMALGGDIAASVLPKGASRYD